MIEKIEVLIEANTKTFFLSKIWGWIQRRGYYSQLLAAILFVRARFLMQVPYAPPASLGAIVTTFLCYLIALLAFSFLLMLVFSAYQARHFPFARAAATLTAEGLHLQAVEHDNPYAEMVGWGDVIKILENRRYIFLLVKLKKPIWLMLSKGKHVENLSTIHAWWTVEHQPKNLQDT